MKLYAVDYEYTVGNGKPEKDTWFIAAEDDFEIRKRMENQRKMFLSHDCDILKYSFKKVVITDNGYFINLEKDD